jgi:uncharacterized damage-inducible protein DinB
MDQEPQATTADPAELFAAYLRYYREAAIAKVAALTDDEQRSSRLPSGWTPLELLQHLAYMEQRWFSWNFSGAHVDQPWGDRRDGRREERWFVSDDVDLAAVVARLRDGGARTDALLASHPLDEVSRPGPDYPGTPAPLAWICFHVLQEYARHVGHLDIAVELAGGPTGE